MKKIIILIGITLISSFLFAKEKKINCESTLAKLKPECNFIGSGVKNLKKFSSKHKTVGETLGIDKKEKKTLREFSEENDLQQALELVRGSNAIQRASNLAETFARESKEALNWLPESACQRALLDLPDYVLSRLY